jgi:RimJ/RimL family protein N-acetyltransferase
MRQSGNLLQWGDDYPSAGVFKHDIDRGCSYLVESCDNHVENGKTPVGTFAFIPSPEPTYAKIYQGSWIDESQLYFVIHRIASTPTSHGVMKAILDFCFSQTNNIRIDTHRDNVIMQHLLDKYGFTYCGIIYLLNGDERLAYQRVNT